MCGFFGTFFGNQTLAKKMFSLQHRGPDGTNSFENKDVYFKHFRLAIIGNEKNAKQPMFSFDGSVGVVFNGEIYNYKELASSIGRKNLIEYGDTRVLVELLAKEGLSCFSKLNGMFSMAIYFKYQNEIVLLRDRFGIKPLFYKLHGNSIYFASEIKSLKKIFSDITFDNQKIINFLDNAEYPHFQDTFYKNIKQLQGGTYLKMNKNGFKIHKWFCLKEYFKNFNKNNLSFEGYEDLLKDSIQLRTRSDVPISLHYSAGTDSTSLLLKLKEVYEDNIPINTFTMAYNELSIDESYLAEEYCKELNIKNHKVYLNANEVPHLAATVNQFQDEPYAGIPVIAYYKMNKFEKDLGYVVSLEGQGGDEGLGGYLYHIYLAAYDLYTSGSNNELLELILKNNNLNIKEVINQSEKLIENGFNVHTDLTDFKTSNNKLKFKKFYDWLTTIQVYDILINKIPRVLRFHDRVSMALGREIRFPLLDHRLITYGLALDVNLKYHQGYSKGPLRNIIKSELKNVYNQSKRSVVTPQTIWLKNELKTWAYERIELLNQKKIIPDKYFSSAQAFFSEKSSENSFKVWQLINLSFNFE